MYGAAHQVVTVTKSIGPLFTDFPSKHRDFVDKYKVCDPAGSLCIEIFLADHNILVHAYVY